MAMQHPVTGKFTADPAAEAQAATAAGMAAFRERQDFYMAHPEGVAAGWEPPPDSTGLPPAGLGYANPPPPAGVYVADRPGLVPVVLPVPAAVDMSAGPALTGCTHGGWAPPGRAGDGVVLVSPPRRRSLWARMTGRGR